MSDFYDAGLNEVGLILNSNSVGYPGAASWQDLPGGGWESPIGPLRK